jgi:hypothetical protein
LYKDQQHLNKISQHLVLIIDQYYQYDYQVYLFDNK